MNSLVNFLGGHTRSYQSMTNINGSPGYFTNFPNNFYLFSSMDWRLPISLSLKIMVGLTSIGIWRLVNLVWNGPFAGERIRIRS